MLWTEAPVNGSSNYEYNCSCKTWLYAGTSWYVVCTVFTDGENQTNRDNQQGRASRYYFEGKTPLRDYTPSIVKYDDDIVRPSWRYGEHDRNDRASKLIFRSNNSELFYGKIRCCSKILLYAGKPG